MPQSVFLIKALGTIAAGIGAIFAGMKLKEILGKQKVETTTTELSKSGKEENTPVSPEGFNVTILSNICRDYGISVENIDDLRLLIERIETTEKSRIIKRFYNNAVSIESMIQLWDSLEIGTINLSQGMSHLSGRIIPTGDIDKLANNSGLYLSNGMSATQKVQALINNALKRADDGFRSLYGERINMLKTQFVIGTHNEHLYKDIKSDLERYVKFI